MIRSAQCPSEEAVSRAFPNAELDIIRHVETCEHCRRTWRELEELVRIGRQLPSRVHAPDQIEVMRHRLLASATSPRPTARRHRIPIAIAAGSIILFLLTQIDRSETPVETLQPAPPVEPLQTRRPIVRGSEQSVFVHRIEHGRHGQEEIVELTEGRIDLDVDPLESTKSFRVSTTDCEIRVSGAAFVSAERGRLTLVEVISGQVEILPRDGSPVTLTAGGRWSVAPSVAGRKPPRSIDRSKAVLEPPALEPEPVKRVDAAEEAFLDGWRRYKAGDFEAAAEAFRLALRDPADPVAADAEYWRGVALAKAGHGGEAVDAMRTFLERRPSSARAGELSVMLGRQLIDLGRPGEARAWFERALGDPSPDIRERAQRALSALDRSRR